MAKLVVGNWKMNLNPAEAVKLVGKLQTKLTPSKRVEVVVCPPSLDLHAVSEHYDKTKLKLGAQNIHFLDHGPFTGEISGTMLKGLASYVIIGHSERRAMGEDDKLIAKKVAAAFRNGLTPILCVGENLQEREAGLSAKIVDAQVTADLALLTAGEVSDLVIAYEPIWALSTGDGKGKHATPDAIRPPVRAIRQAVEDLYGESGGMGLRILYGGSVNTDDCGAYLHMSGIDGVLVGGDSLVYEDFATIVNVAGREAED